MGRWWPLVWVATSALLLAASTLVTDAVIVAIAYIGANLIGMGTLWLRAPRPSPVVMRRLGIAASCQAPVAIIAVFYPDQRRGTDGGADGDAAAGAAAPETGPETE